MDAARAKELIDLLSIRDGEWRTLWGIFQTVSAATVGIVAANKVPAKFRLHASTVLTVGFLLFAAGNFWNLYVLRIQRDAIVNLVLTQPMLVDEIRTIADASRPSPLWQLILYHWGLSAFVLSMFWAIPYFQNRQEEGERQQR
jgi:hypothetical protein